MKRALASLSLTVACHAAPAPAPEETTAAALPSEPAELFVFAHDAELIQPARAAARRIETASGIRVHVNAYGSIATAVPIFGSDFLCASGTEGRRSAHGIAIARDCNVAAEMVLTHELLHELGANHLEPPQRGILNDASDGPLDAITADDLSALCSVQPCTQFAPES